MITRKDAEHLVDALLNAQRLCDQAEEGTDATCAQGVVDNLREHVICHLCTADPSYPLYFPTVTYRDSTTYPPYRVTCTSDDYEVEV